MHAEVKVLRWVWVLPHVLSAGEERIVRSQRDQTKYRSCLSLQEHKKIGNAISCIPIKANMFT